MRGFAILLIFLGLSFANSFGHARMTIERAWTVESDTPFNFTGAVAVNDSNQRILSIDSAPEMDFHTDENGTVWAKYSGKGDQTIVARAIVDVDYDTRLTTDSVPSGTHLESTPLTEADEEMETQAFLLMDESSSLRTIRNLVNWVHGYIKYDLSYWGSVDSAKEAYAQKRGVCVEYSHLLISMARSLGFETRYVSGYVYANAWQPHAWAEIRLPGYGWIPADPTFGQAGILDNTHLAVQKGADQSSTFDSLLSTDPDAALAVDDSVSVAFQSEDGKGVDMGLTLDNSTYLVEVVMENSRPEYVFGTYSFIAPDGYGKEGTQVVLLKPYETLRMYHGLNYSLFRDGFSYRVPLSASFNDARAESVLEVGPLGISEAPDPSQTCLVAAALSLLVLISAGLLLK
ncbi:MAG: transglutaminase-like domain-containing protein [Candidatus Micrarchaeota archaeon]